MPSDLQFAHDLIEWYWQYGYARGRPAAGAQRAKYDLPPAQWLAALYEAHGRLLELELAARPRRPAVAFWGLSQTGKSTALAFVNGDREPSGDPASDGVRTGLHWPNGQPFIYQSPYRRDGNYPLHWTRRVYNPYNTGDDASSCLTRLVVGGDQVPGGLAVEDALHPVRVRLTRPIEILNTLARGYDSQCWGVGSQGRHVPWTPESLELAVAKVRSRFPLPATERIEPDRAAFEQVLLLVQTLQELFTLEIETYATAAADPAAHQGWLDTRLLASPLFTSSLSAADAITAELLWGGAEPITQRYRQLRALEQKLRAAYGERCEFHASLEAASLFIDMSSGVYAFSSWPPHCKQGIQAQMIAELGIARDPGGRVLIGCGARYGDKLGAKAEDYALFQSLVYELVLPVNLDHLPAGAGRDLLARADILDFPGVGREPVNEHTRINFKATGKKDGEGEPFTPTEFFSRIIKRGKTTSIVANYARRMNIDEFSVLQSLDGKEIPSEAMVGQILDGLRAWRRLSGFDNPDYLAKPGRRLPLNFVLTFWGSKVANFRPGEARAYTNSVAKVYRSYGPLASGDTAVAYALNYHWFGTANVDLGAFSVGDEAYQAVTDEPAFRDFFREGVSRQSFDAMITDRRTGGLGFFFDQLTASVTGYDVAWRAARLARLQAAQREALAALLAWPNLRLPIFVEDGRAGRLQEFRRQVLDGAADADESRMAALSHALRAMFNVEADSMPQPPDDFAAISSSLAERWFYAWKEQQLRAYGHWLARGRRGEPDWSHLQFRSREELDRVLQAFIEALGERVLAAVAQSTGRRLALMNALSAEMRAHYARRAIAVELTNRLVYWHPAEPDYPRRTTDEDVPVAPGEDQKPSRAQRTRAYRSFVGPFFERQLSAMLLHLAPRRERPELPGDHELESVLQQTEVARNGDLAAHPP